ncbi:MAG: O-antigen ligase family protein [Chloroflexi bacterium]|nr:O-antigen ligase family protein [Chloroflexota bacterium]
MDLFRGADITLRDYEWRSRAIALLLALIAGLALGVLVSASSPIYVLAGLIGLGVGVGLLINAQAGLLTFVAVATLLPYGVVPVPVGGVRLTLIDVALTALLMVWMVRLLTGADVRLEVTRLGGPLLVFILLALVSFAVGTSYYVSAESTRLFLKLINSIVFFFTVVNCVRSRVQLRQILVSLIVGGAAAAALGIVLYLIPAATATQALLSLRVVGYYPSAGDVVVRYIADTNTERAISTSVDPNVFGALLMLCGTLAVSQLLSSKPALSRKWLAPLTATILVGLVLSLSRGSWMGFMAAMLFLATMKNRKLWLLYLGLAVILYFGVVPADVPFLSHLLSGLEAKDKAAAMRLGEYKDAIELISKYPWFGVGFGSSPSIDLYVGVSSIYLLMAEQMGLIGLGAYLGTMALLFVEVFKKAGRIVDAELQYIVLGLAAALVAALGAGVFDHHFFNIRFPHVSALFWLIAGLIFVGLRLAEQREHV